MALVKKDTFSGEITNNTLVVPDFTQLWIINDGAGDLTLTFANTNVLTLKSGEELKYGCSENVIYKGFSASGLATTYRYMYII